MAVYFSPHELSRDVHVLNREWIVRNQQLILELEIFVGIKAKPM